MNLLFRFARRFGFVLLLGVHLSLAQTGAPPIQPNLPESELFRTIDELGGQARFSEAIPYAKELVKRTEGSFGANHTNTAGALFMLADLHYRVANYTNAFPLYVRSLSIREKMLGPEHPDTAMTLNNLALLYQAVGAYQKAEPLYLRNLAICEKVLGPDDPDTAIALNNIAALYQTMGEYPKAEPLFLRGLKINEKAMGPEHPDTALSLNNLAHFYQTMGAYAKAQPLFERSLKIAETTSGPEHTDTARALNNLGSLYFAMGNYTKAEASMLKGLKICVKVLGPEHPDTASSQGQLGELHRYLGDYAKAGLFFNHRLAVYEKVFGLAHPETAKAMHSLGLLQLDMGEHANAETLMQESLKIYEAAAGFNHPDTAMALNNLALLYRSMDDYAKAEPLYQRSLKLTEKMFGPEHPNTALLLNNLARLYELTGDFAKAEPLYRRSVAINEQVLGPVHPGLATSLVNLAGAYRRMGQYAKAEPLLQRSVVICEKALGPSHYGTAMALNNMALLYDWMHDYTQAEPLYELSLKILERTVGPDHPETATVLENLSVTKFNLRRFDEALALERKCRAVAEKSMGRIMAFTSERQRLSYQANANRALVSMFGSLGSALDLAEFTLRTKGMVLDSLLEDEMAARASADPAVKQNLEAMRSSGRRLTKLQMEAGQDTNLEARTKRQEEQEGLERLFESLQVSMANNVASLGEVRRALRVKVSDVQTALAKGTVLLEFVRYHHFSGKASAEPRYGVVVIGSETVALEGANVGEPIWVSLDSAKLIEQNLQAYGAMMRGEMKGDIRLLQSLYAQLIEPIRSRLAKDTTTLIISPDAELSFLSFATLVDAQERFLAEHYSTRYVASGRDLVFGTAGQARSRSFAAFANPAFAEKPAVAATRDAVQLTMQSADRRDYAGLTLRTLPNTTLEAHFLRERSSTWRLEGAVYVGAEASELQVKSVKSPYILHLATHGFLLPDNVPTKQPAMQTRLLSEQRAPVVFHNPMLRSGLAFAGAQLTLDAWKRGEVPETENDGILMAQEVGTMDLKDTWLVVLSACDTGIGEARNGEGVLGLRRGFVQAGAQNLLMTLWPISDKWSVDIMKAFYEKAMVSGDAPQAMAEVQAEWLGRLRKEKGVLIAARLAGPFVLSTRGRQSVK